MLRTAACALLLASSLSLAAADGPSPTVAPAPATFGLTAEEAGFSGGPGVMIKDVRAGGTADSLGLMAGDRLLSVNGIMVGNPDSVAKAIANAKVGDAINVEFQRGDEKRSAKGQMLERPRPVNIAKQIEETRREIEATRKVAGERAKEPSLAEILQQLKDLDSRLPKAAAAFKKQYPNGEFDIRIAITIVSDKTATSPIEIGNIPATAPAVK